MNGEAPDWSTLSQTITKQYDEVTADRTLTKAKIYFYYNKDWSKFCAGIVHYTNSYELANDFALLNLNAEMLLRYSESQSDFKQAMRWTKAALDSDPENVKFKTTCDGLKAKIIE